MLVRRVKEKYVSGIVVQYIDHNGILIKKFYPVSFRRYKKEIQKRLNGRSYKELEI